MADVKFTRLHCLRTEDFAGGDEPKLVILVDGNVTGQISIPNMVVGGIELINQTVTFNSEVVVRLFDEDTGVFDPDDFLGEVSIGSDDDDTKGIFDQEGAYYVLEWENVTPVAPDGTDISIDDSPGTSPGPNA